MTTTTEHNGRLGNQIIRNLAVSLIAEKFNLQVNYSNKHLINTLGIELFNGSNNHNYTIQLNDANYFSIYNSNSLNYNLYPNDHFFQTKEIIEVLYTHLNTYKIKNNIINTNSYKDRYSQNNDLFIHIRLTDATKYNPGINYYLNTINNIRFDNLYIATDDKTHEFISIILAKYPNATILEYDEIHTIQFGSTCKNIILSHGSFSAVIGYIAFYSNIYYPEYEADKMWHGDMFSIDNWIKCRVI